MKCPKCGSERLHYVVSRKKYWKKTKTSKGTDLRTDFRVECKKCGYKGTLKTNLDKLAEKLAQPKEEKPKQVIKMKYDD